jgi:hypothetical protein
MMAWEPLPERDVVTRCRRRCGRHENMTLEQESIVHNPKQGPGLSCALGSRPTLHPVVPRVTALDRTEVRYAIPRCRTHDKHTRVEACGIQHGGIAQGCGDLWGSVNRFSTPPLRLPIAFASIQRRSHGKAPRSIRNRAKHAKT